MVRLPVQQPADVGPLARFSGPSQGNWSNYRVTEKIDGSLDEANMREMMRGYLACISFVDAQAGIVLDVFELASPAEAYGVASYDRDGEIVDLGSEMGIVEKSGAWYSFDGERIGQGRENSKEFLRQNPAMADELEAIIRQRAAGGEIEMPLGGGEDDGGGEEAEE